MTFKTKPITVVNLLNIYMHYIEVNILKIQFVMYNCKGFWRKMDNFYLKRENHCM